MARRRSAPRMARLVAQWRRSGESRAGFARRHRIPAWTFWYWCRKLSREAAEGDREAPTTFVPVQVAADPMASVLEIVFSSGERLHVRSGAPAELVYAAVTALRVSC
jgi:transposase-like protein